MAEKVLDIIKKLDLTDIYLVGHSMGGAIAQQIAITDSAIIKHLFLISSFAQLDNIARIFLTARYELIKAKVDKNITALSSIPTIFGNKFLSDPNNVELAVQRMVNNTQTLPGMYGQLNACLEHNTKYEISKIECKTSIITGTDDILVRPAHSMYLHDAIKQSDYIAVADAAHMVQLEQPYGLAQILINACR
jgi:3-oxoadipate enol-lactonase